MTEAWENLAEARANPDAWYSFLTLEDVETFVALLNALRSYVINEGLMDHEPIRLDRRCGYCRAERITIGGTEAQPHAMGCAWTLAYMALWNVERGAE